MSSDWLKKQAEEIKERDATEQRRREWQMHCAQVLKVKGPQFWKAVVSLSLQYARDFNVELSDQRRQIESIQEIPRGFTLRRAHYPAVNVVATYDESSQAVHCVIRRTPDSKTMSYEDIDDFSLLLDSDGGVYAGSLGNNVDGFARHFIQPFLEGL